jgi:hypothetical protein
VITVHQGGVEVSAGAVETLRGRFDRQGYAVIPGFLAPGVLRALLSQIRQARFRLEAESVVAGQTQIVPSNDPAMISLHFILNRPELFRTVSAIAGIPAPVNFTSRLHRTTVDPLQQIDWHDDGGLDRVLGLNINLTEQPYTGGTLQLRDPEGRMRGEIGQLPAGHAFLFRVGSRWDHRLTPLTSGERTVAVGWFRSKPSWEMNALNWLRSGFIYLGDES